MIRPGQSYALSSDPALPSTSIANALSSGLPADGRHLNYGGGAKCAEVLCARFRVTGASALQLLEVLPQVLVVNPNQNAAHRWLGGIVNQLHREVRDEPIGSQLIVTRLLHLLFIEMVRAWVSRAGQHKYPIKHLDDPSISRAIAAIHADPMRAWTVEQLAAHIGISRSAFAQKFKSAVGEPPLRHVTNIRLESAFAALRANNNSVSEIADNAGYGSGAAFSRAFKARFGVSPGVIRRSAM